MCVSLLLHSLLESCFTSNVIATMDFPSKKQHHHGILKWMRIGAKGQLNELIAQDLQELHNQGVFPILQNKGEIKGKNFSSKF
jgi:hypothetical protein